ncbi:haloalkane dehalogenase [Rhizocola hellebori]|uniref:Haloalkane dehalogenase n=2 Tax=Rhizocola hellebori TaxID=1392758 RepID=A0A8J3VDP8_9ACTN|nr:haloalkane dehalogenase [Rhizocola hellebori]
MLNYVEVNSDADGTPIVFLHGNPSSSRSWRNVLPAVGGDRRLLAPDLIGMGQSAKPDIGYTFADHARYLDGWMDSLGLGQVILVGHDWGGALAFDWAAQHPDRVEGLAFFEAIVRPMSWSELADKPRARAETMRSPVGEGLILDSNFFIETAYTGGVLHPLDADEIAAYVSPYPTRESRRPILQWARSLPLDGDPAEVHQRMMAYGKWLAASTDVPKLLLTFEGSPVLSITPAMAQWCRENIAGLTTEHIGPAGHHATEDQPEAIGAAIGRWAGALR